MKNSTWSILGPFIRKYVPPYMGRLSVAVFFMLVAAGATATFAKLIQPVLDKAMIGVQHNPDTIGIVLPLGFAILAVFAIRGIATYLHTIKMNEVSQMIVADIQKDIFSHFMMLDLKFFHTHPSGQLVSRVTSDVNVMRTAVSDSLTGVGSNLITLIFLVGVMIWQDWRLALVSFIVFPFASGLVMILGRRLRKISKSIQGETARLMGVLTQIFQGIRQVQAFGMEDAERKKASDAVWAVRSLNIKAVKVGSLSTPINEVLVGLVVFGIVVYGGYRIAAGHLTPGGLMSFIAAFALAYEPMKKLAKLNNTLQMGVGAAERVREMLDKIPGIVSDPGATQLAVKSPDVVFENVSFCYAAEEEARALDRLSFTAAGGKVTALVGASGSGKTTVFSLLLRFYDPQEGMVLIGGQDVRGVTVSSLRGSAALVSQDITIFDDTVAANIAYGCPGASEGKIREAARAAAAEEFILKLPEGYETQVGENGVRLSGGQRQRISLARAILRDAPILLLDEATSALDNESERLIQQALIELEKDRTTLVIAHRLSTIQNADKILVMDKGRIVEEGRHEDLLARGGVYARMYHSSKIGEAA